MIFFCAFYTRDSIYEQEAARLRLSLDKLGLPHDIVPVDSKGSWAKNAAMTAWFWCDMLAKHDGPIVCVDADAVVWRRPILFDSLSPTAVYESSATDGKQASLGYDLAVHYRKGVELMNGTAWLANNARCKALIDDYRKRVEADSACKNEQAHLAAAIKADKEARVYRLPASMCFVEDLMAADIGAEFPVIQHLQCSREHTGSSLLPSRKKMVEKAEKKLAETP